MVVRAGLPLILTWLVNLLGRRKIPGYHARVRRVSLDVTTPRLVLTGFSLVKLSGKHSLSVDSVVIGSRWRDFLRSALVADIKVDSPRLMLDLNRPNNEGVRDEEDKLNGNSQAKGQPTWQAKMRSVPAFRIITAALTDGEIHLLGIPGQNGADIRVDRLKLSFDNITNSLALAPTLMTKAACSARIMATGNLNLRAEAYPLAEQPTFNLDLQTR